MQEKYVARAIILNPRKEILVTQRASGYLGGKWDVPGGLIEPGEHPGDAAARETREEVNLAFKGSRFFKLDSYQPPESIFMWNIFYFSGSGTGRLRIDPSEVADAAWVAEDGLDQVDFTYPQVRDTMHEFFAGRPRLRSSTIIDLRSRTRIKQDAGATVSGPAA